MNGRRIVAAVTGSNGVGASPCSDIGSSEVSEDDDEKESSDSESDEESDVIEGAYSCFSGDEDSLLLTLLSAGTDWFSWLRARSFAVLLDDKLGWP